MLIEYIFFFPFVLNSEKNLDNLEHFSKNIFAKKKNMGLKKNYFRKSIILRKNIFLL